MILKKTNEEKLALISWPLDSKEPKSDKDVYLVLGELYDKDVINNIDILKDFNDNIQYIYHFKIKKVDNNIKIYNEEDFIYLRKKFRLTSNVTLHNCDKNTKIVFRTPVLFNISIMKPIFTNISVIPNYIAPKSSHCRIFMVLPYENPVLRGELLKQCIYFIKEHNYLFILIGDLFGKNKRKTSSLMNNYLLSCGIDPDAIIKNIYDKFPDSITESLELLKFMLDIHHYATHDLFIASASFDICKVMLFSKQNKINKDINVQFICD